MKKTLIILCLAILSTTTVFAKEPVSGYRFKHYMHEIFKNYRNANISIEMRDYDLAEVHTRHLLENLSQIPNFTKDLRADGINLDEAFLLTTINGLRTDVTELRKAIKAKDAGKMKKLQPKLLQSCIGCHTEANLKWLFRLPMSKNLFEEYMHEIGDNYAMAEQLLASNDIDEAEDYIKIANQYLTLLEKIAPYEGPSGVILDRKRFVNEIGKAQGFALLVLDDFKEKRAIDLTALKKPLNNVCVACHEPAMLK